MIGVGYHHEFPPDREALRRRAVRLEWLTIAFMLSAIVLLYLTLGSSQAMRTAWVEDILSLIPPASFLVASRIRERPPDDRYPYGYHRAVSIGFLCAALALLVFGALLLLDAVLKLVSAERPTIGSVVLLGHHVWLGWPMIAALAYTIVPPVLLGRAKLPLARRLHDKVLFADAEMNRADWLTAVAAIVGIFGIGVGLWWADAVAAAAISFSILRDGVGNVRAVVADLMDRRPASVDHQSIDALPARVESELRALPWVRDVRVRLREEGHVYFGEALVVPVDERGLVGRLADAADPLAGLDWRLHDLVIAPVTSLPAPAAGTEGAKDAPKRGAGGTIGDSEGE